MSHRERDRLIAEEFGMIDDSEFTRRTRQKWLEAMPGIMELAEDYRRNRLDPQWHGDNYSRWPKFSENPSACVDLLEKLSDALVEVRDSEVMVAVGGYFETAEKLSEALPRAVWRWLKANKRHPKTGKPFPQGRNSDD